MKFPKETPADPTQDIPVSEPTAAPGSSVGRRLLDPRENESNTCGWYSFSGNYGPSFEALTCLEECTTSGAYFGCTPNFRTTCYEGNDDPCDTAEVTNSATICCTDTDDYCMTGFMTIGSNLLTVFRCGSSDYSGEMTIVPDTVSTVYASGPAPSEASGAPSGEGSSSSSGTPIGAIVGGVVGGVALVILVALFLWILRFQKRTAAEQREMLQRWHQDIQTHYKSHGASMYGPGVSSPSEMGGMAVAEMPNSATRGSNTQAELSGRGEY